MARMKDRESAGRLLAPLVNRYPLDDPVVVGIGSGGVAVGAGIARHLGCPLDILDIQELDAGDPLHPSRAFGALSGTGHVLVHPDAVDHVSNGAAALRRALDRATAAGGHHVDGPGSRGGTVPISWRTVILVDDGSSSRQVLAAALDLARAGRPARILLALPAGPQELIDELERISGDVVVGLVIPWTEWFAWHGRIYDDDTRPSRDQVGELLAG